MAKQLHKPFSENEIKDMYALHVQIPLWRKDLANAKLIADKDGRLIKNPATHYILLNAWVGIINTIVLRLFEAIWFLDRAERAHLKRGLIEGNDRVGYKCRYRAFIDLIDCRHKFLAHFIANRNHHEIFWKFLRAQYGDKTIFSVITQVLEEMEDIIRELIETGIFTKVKDLQATTTPVPALTDDDINRIISACDTVSK